jgi:HSP20 family protein
MPSLFWHGADWFREAAWQPPADVYRTRTGWLVKLDLAGVRPADLSVRAEGSRLTVQGVRRDCTAEEGCNHFRLEIAYSYFERTIDLPCNLQSAALATDYRDGMLLVQIDTEKDR